MRNVTGLGVLLAIIFFPAQVIAHGGHERGGWGIGLEGAFGVEDNHFGLHFGRTTPLERGKNLTLFGGMSYAEELLSATLGAGLDIHLSSGFGLLFEVAVEPFREQPEASFSGGFELLIANSKENSLALGFLVGRHSAIGLAGTVPSDGEMTFNIHLHLMFSD